MTTRPRPHRRNLPQPDRKAPEVTHPKRSVHAALLCACLLCVVAGAAAPAQAAVLDFLFGKKAGEADAAPVDPKQRNWRLGEFSSVQLVSREADAAPNQHPAAWSADTLRQQLAAVRAELRGGAQPLFAADELDALVLPLSQALSLAGPNDDVLLLSTHRRGSGILIAPFGVTARLFVQDGRLQMIVHDARLDFVDTYIGTRVAPNFTYGSRAKAGTTVLQSAAALSRRADWVAMPPTVVAATPAAPAVAAPVVNAPVAPPALPSPSVPAPTASPAAPPPAPAPLAKPRGPGFADEIEQRLLTLKRLLDRGLISEAEYQQKRKEVLQLL